MAEEQDGDLLTGGPEDTSTTDADNQDSGGSGGIVDDASSVADDPKDQPVGWKGQLSEDLSKEKGLDKFNGKGAINKLASSYLEAEDRLKRSVTLSEEPTEEELSRVHALLGRPESQDGYDFADVEIPEGRSITDTKMAELKRLAFKSGLNNDQAREMIQDSLAREANAIKEIRRVMKKQRVEAETELRSDLGDDYDKHLKAGKRFLQKYGDAALTKELKDTGFGSSPALIRALGKAGLDISEDNALRGEKPPGSPKTEHAFPVAAKMAAEKDRYYGPG